MVKPHQPCLAISTKCAIVHICSVLSQEPTTAILVIVPLSNMHICFQPGKMELSFYQPASTWITVCQLVYPASWQICNSWQVLTHQQHVLIFYWHWLHIVGMCRNNCRMLVMVYYLARNVSLNFIIPLFYENYPARWYIAMDSYIDSIPHPADKMYHSGVNLAKMVQTVSQYLELEHSGDTTWPIQIQYRGPQPIYKILHVENWCLWY